VNAQEVSDVLAKAAAYDQRTVGTADILAWLEVIGDLDVHDALLAVARHYSSETARIMPAHIREQVRAIHNERHQLEDHEIRALPSRFEEDVTRDARIKDGLAKCSAVLAVVMAHLEAKRGERSPEQALARLDEAINEMHAERTEFKTITEKEN